MGRRLYFYLSGWLASLLAAFGAGYWMTSTPTRTADESVMKPGAVLQEDWELTGSKESFEGMDSEELQAPVVVDSLGSETNSLQAVLAGAGAPLVWEQASLEAGLLSSEEARSWVEALLETPQGPRRDDLLLTLLGRVALKDPQVAMALASQITSVTSEEQARRRILEVWGGHDPAAAQMWLEENSVGLPGRVRSERLEAWIEGYARSNPSAAFAYASALPEGSSLETRLKRELVEEVISSQVANGDLEQVEIWLQTLPEGPVRREALEEFYSEWAEQDPVQASEHFLQNRSGDSERVAAGIVRNWAESDPEAASDFVAALDTSDPAFEVAVSSLIERWSRYDLEGPAEWLNELPPSPEIDRAVAVYSVRASREDPAGAMSWAESIATEQTRNRVMQRVASSWQETDPSGLETYLQQSGLDESTANRLREGSNGNDRRFRN